jgi:hypothetical protein
MASTFLGGGGGDTASSPTDAYGSGTRQYNLAAATRTAIANTSSAAVAIGTLGASREILLIPSTRCFVRFGASDVAASSATDATVLPLPSDTQFTLRVPIGVTHFTVIRSTADGFLHCIPVV